MASVLKNDDEKNVMPDETPEERDEKDDREESASAKPDYRAPQDDKAERAARKTGFFTIYKSGQGYWTRMGTVGGAALLAMLTANFIFQQLRVWLPDSWNEHQKMRVTLIACAAFLAAFAGVVFWVINKPSNVDFLIATDSEMKKVNWTSRKELIGSTKVVIVFMFLIAAILFVVDLMFSYLFYLVSVLKTKPF
jgi:preprotein translocase subunit SecE